MYYRRLIVALGSFLLCSSIWSQPNTNTPSLIPYRSDTLWGYARPGGEILIPPQFAKASLFSRYLQPLQSDYEFYSPDANIRFPVLDYAYAQVHLGNLYGLIDESGHFVVPPVSDRPLHFFPVDSLHFWIGIHPKSNALTENEADGYIWQVMLLHKSGRVVVPFEAGYQRFEYEQGDCSIHMDDDPYGNQSIQPAPYDCTPWSFYSDYVSVQKNGKMGVIQKDGTELFAPIWNEVSRPREGRIFVKYSDTTSANYNQRWALVGPGNQILKTFPAGLWIGHDVRYGPIPVRQENEMGYLNSSGEWAFSEKFSIAWPFSKNGYAIVREKSGAWKIIDSTGLKIIDLLEPKGCQPWRDGYYIQLADSLFYRYDKHFKKTGAQGLDGFPSEFVWKGKTCYAARLHGKWGLIDEQEQIVLPFNYPYPINRNSNISFPGDSVSYFQVFSGNLKGLLDSNFKEIIPCQFDQFYPIGDGTTFYVITDANKMGLYSATGQQILSPVYDQIGSMKDKRFGWYSVQQGELYGTMHQDGTVQLPLVYQHSLSHFSPQAPYNMQPTLDGLHVFDSTGQLIVRVPMDVDECWQLEKTNCDTCFEFYVRKGDHRFFIDQTGIPPLPYAEYEWAVRKGNFVIVQKNGLSGVFSYPDLRQLVPIEFQYVQEINGCLFVKKPEWPTLRLWDTTTQTAQNLDIPFTQIRAGGAGLLAVDLDCKWYGFLDTGFQLAIPLVYSNAYSFAEGLACVRDSNGRWGYIDRTGAWVIEPKFSKASVFQNGRAWVHYPADLSGDVRAAFIDRQGNTLFEWRNASAVSFQNAGQYFIMEDHPVRGQYSLLDTLNWKLLLENCDCIQAVGDKIVVIKNDQIQVMGGTLEPGELRTVPYEKAGVQFVSACALTAMQDMRGNTLIPFGDWSQYFLHPESRSVTIHINNPQGLSTDRIYNLSGKFLQEFVGAQLSPLNETFLNVTREGKRELWNLNSGRLLAPLGNYHFSLTKGMTLVKVSGGDGRLLGYCDEAACYFKD